MKLLSLVVKIVFPKVYEEIGRDYYRREVIKEMRHLYEHLATMPVATIRVPASQDKKVSN